MSKSAWSIIFRVNLVLLMVLLAAMLIQIKGVDATHLALAAVTSALIFLVSYKLKSDGVGAVDYAKMLDRHELASAKQGSIDSFAADGAPDFAVEVIGVVTGIGAAETEEGLKVEINLSPWRIKGQAVQTDDLSIRLPKLVSQKECDRFVSNFAGDHLIAEFKTGAITDEDIYGGKLAKLVEVVSTDVSDSELEAISNEQYRPVDIELDGTPIRFSMDDDEGMFAGVVRWLGKDIKIFLDTDKSFQLQAYAGDAGSLLADAKSIDLKAREKISDLLLKENRKLLVPKDGADSHDIMVSRPCLSRIHVLSGGEFIFYFAPDENPDGKEIVVYGSLKDGPVEAELFC